jgi:hypothetical protein
MRRVITAAIVWLALVASATVASSTSASAGSPIKAGEHFRGLVNGSHKTPAVQVVCPGPVGSSSTGPVAGKQTMTVVHVRKGQGFTGPFSSVFAWFAPVAGGAAPTQLHFTHYSSPQYIPTSIQVPCGGTGSVVFSSCPYLAPCAAGWVTDDVKVKFENIAA